MGPNLDHHQTLIMSVPTDVPAVIGNGTDSNTYFRVSVLPGFEVYHDFYFAFVGTSRSSYIAGQLSRNFTVRLSVRVTHWGRVTNICVSELTIIGSDNGLWPGRRQAIIWTNAGILLIRTNFRNKLQWNSRWNTCIFIQENARENVVWKMASILSRLQCVIAWDITFALEGENELLVKSIFNPTSELFYSPIKKQGQIDIVILLVFWYGLYWIFTRASV